MHMGNVRVDRNAADEAEAFINTDPCDFTAVHPVNARATSFQLCATSTATNANGSLHEPTAASAAISKSDPLTFSAAIETSDDHKLRRPCVASETNDDGKQHEPRAASADASEPAASLSVLPARPRTGTIPVNAALGRLSSPDEALLGSAEAARAIAAILDVVSAGDVYQRYGRMHGIAGEVLSAGVASMIDAMGPFSDQVTFLDIGAGINNVLAQIALTSNIKACIGLEVRRTCRNLAGRASKVM
ncbi:hypothetical protein PHYPSEUDO_012387 [Phytophthora pseudosyringae]|uniref:DOT1 domain-containing protein n=1 Tax=Phytophthora pseudosyringae TaxID=221518 RepID=A0A8T1V7D7_9STRA|nr:hypothetical protein PHYPSEUDO_012387 [Phytophthora pseudosyringae]